MMYALCVQIYSHKLACLCDINQISEDCFVIEVTGKTQDSMKMSKKTPRPYVYPGNFKTLEDAKKCIANWDEGYI